MKPWRIALVFCFGLLHGMGFAGVLTDLGIPRSEFLTALVAFNAGVELGQLTVIGLAFLLLASWARKKPWYRSRVIIPASILIGFVGLYWTIERSAW
jgi:HupE/UreJ protein